MFVRAGLKCRQGSIVMSREYLHLLSSIIPDYQVKGAGLVLAFYMSEGGWQPE